MFLSPHISKDKLSRLCISSIPLESLQDLNDFQSDINSLHSARFSRGLGDFEANNENEDAGDDSDYNILTTFQFTIVIIILQSVSITFLFTFTDYYTYFEKLIMEMSKLNLIVTTLILILLFHLLVINLSLLIEKINYKLLINVNFIILALSIFGNSFNLLVKEFYLIFLSIGILTSFLIFLIQLLILINWVDIGCLSSWLGFTLSGSVIIAHLLDLALNAIKQYSSIGWSLRTLAFILVPLQLIFNYFFNQKIDFILLQDPFKLNWGLILNLQFAIWLTFSFCSSIATSGLSYILSSVIKLSKTQNWVLLIVNLISWVIGSSALSVLGGKLKSKNFSIILLSAISTLGFCIWFTQLNYSLVLVYSSLFHFLFGGYLPNLLLSVNETLQLQTKAISMRGLILTTIQLNHLIPYLLVLILTHNVRMSTILNSYLILISSSFGLIASLWALACNFYFKAVKIQN